MCRRVLVKMMEEEDNLSNVEHEGNPLSETYNSKAMMSG